MLDHADRARLLAHRGPDLRTVHLSDDPHQDDVALGLVEHVQCGQSVRPGVTEDRLGLGAGTLIDQDPGQLRVLPTCDPMAIGDLAVGDGKDPRPERRLVTDEVAES